jgi:hypothetical protein
LERGVDGRVWIIFDVMEGRVGWDSATKNGSIDEWWGFNREASGYIRPCVDEMKTFGPIRQSMMPSNSKAHSTACESGYLSGMKIIEVSPLLVIYLHFY